MDTLTDTHYPEFNLYRPSSTNDFMWCWEIIDPLSQGVYCDGREYSLKNALTQIRMNMAIVESDLENCRYEPKRIRRIYAID